MLHNTSPPLQRWFSNQSNRQQGTLRWLRTFLIAFAILVASAGWQPHRWQKKYLFDRPRGYWLAKQCRPAKNQSSSLLLMIIVHPV